MNKSAWNEVNGFTNLGSSDACVTLRNAPKHQSCSFLILSKNIDPSHPDRQQNIALLSLSKIYSFRLKMWFKTVFLAFQKSRRTCSNDNVRKHSFFRDLSLILLILAGQFEYYSRNIRKGTKALHGHVIHGVRLSSQPFSAMTQPSRHPATNRSFL